MTYALIISSLLSWAIILMLILAVWALARQVGLLHERIQPVGALSLGKAIKAGDTAPVFTLPSLTGGSVSLGRASGQGTLLFFLSETCPVCKTLLPVLDALRRQERLRVVLASDGEADEHLAFIAAHSLQAFPYLLSREVGLAYQISKLPYAVLIDEHGRVASHGLVNTREHLESLLEARRLGHATVQAYNAAQQGVQP
ncbi:methylamine dehydrogenase accessory protein MauD [Pseudomonas mosselii]|uniref:methylamine dehydrogenase accessory protein MauD n=1 Tax=Pseudomonas mosselii TaxID=78327 RepID=UPI002447C9DF|nr:methylamine dehydrogenase accessory protein MauD [Pseudomonas mosselii]MDH0628096.1 methylamine dehydrogenase accessory protein MauD [Pseudomonas mosselii]MDH0676367.1 methylamine dehydrogenase accessory protein MauD [Pseudomonas mosselii]MDH0924073.1 methylamine dehydrogenase accessory protein MauD [Pseudomonas mosselii]MDH1136592.1 methylamine dehydrogenase accessory protein MauD [Pseudomonas mosselii]MDH1140968.1 methylamine dehydrogenase accessory protein MauD [Pseudomonas mosselii]